MKTQRYDVVVVGGGLSGTLAVYRLRQLRPDLRLLLIERGATLGGNHTWSFHVSDVSAAQSQWIAPFVVHEWPAQRVRFPGFERRIATGYRSITSERLHQVALSVLKPATRLGVDVIDAGADFVRLADGEQIVADCVIDCRGAVGDPTLQLGFQKFVGSEIALPVPHGITEPVIMDATVPQYDGYRFVYLLPFGADRLLIEDTYYSDHAALEPAHLESRIADFQRRNGWQDVYQLRREQGVLPIALGGDIDAFWRRRRRESPCACAGLRAALFHPTTGYSLPDAVLLADLLARFSPLETPAVRQMVEAHSCALWRERGFFRRLNRMLFLAADPGERWRVLERFYTLSDGLIERFYASRLTWQDKARILIGRPPLSFARALQALPESAARRASANEPGQSGRAA